jgi:DNA polymerase-1
MRFAYFHSPPERSSYPVCVLAPAIMKSQIEHTYLHPFGINVDDVLILDLHRSEGTKKTPAAEMKAYIEEELAPVLNDMKVQYLLVADAEYFKTLTKAAKVEVHLGYVMDSVWGPWKVVYVPHWGQVFYDPDKVKAKIALAVRAMCEHRLGNYQAPGTSIIKFAAYPLTVQEIEDWLERLIADDRPLTCDIEAFSLKHHTAGIGTITFCWSKHEGIAFPVDLHPEATRIRALLKSFFLRFTQKLIYHSISYDVYVLIYQLFMEDILDTEGLLDGLEVMLRNWDCTKLITYLATNSCAGNVLKLKVLAQEFAGNWAVDSEDLKDITKVPLPELLEYNLVDGLSTWFVKEKYEPVMDTDQQRALYEGLFKDATRDIIQMQLTGLPLYMPQVLVVEQILEEIQQDALYRMMNNPVCRQYIYEMQVEHVAKRNAALKKKQISMADQETLDVTLNPASPDQLQGLLYGLMGLPVIARTDTKQPSTGGKVLKALKNHTKDPDQIALLESLIDWKAVVKMLTDFIPSFKNAALGPDGWHYLFGNFNLGGTISGRLSSSGPNLQNLPSNVYMMISAALLAKFPLLAQYTKKGELSLGKLIKSCFRAPPGWLFCGLDFASLEDKISALTTRDPNKLKVYTDGYDGHCLRAYAYWPQLMPDIDPTSVVSINSIANKYKALRQKSKVPTFALTYDGTFNTLMTGSGLPEDEAKRIFAAYHELYGVSDDWVAAKLNQASIDGFVTVAFGLRLRTPLLKQTIRKTRRTPYEAEAEGRSAGNALGQSWCLLNSRAWTEFMPKVRASKYRLDIRPCAQIHDAGYALIRDDLSPLVYTNEHLVNATFWQQDPAIAHPEVRLGGELSIFWPTWAEECMLPNGAREAGILSAIADHERALQPNP